MILKRWYSKNLGPFQTSNFTCAESNANERKQWIFLICIGFGTCKVRRLKRALLTRHASRSQLFADVTLFRSFFIQTNNGSYRSIYYAKIIKNIYMRSFIKTLFKLRKIRVPTVTNFYKEVILMLILRDIGS